MKQIVFFFSLLLGSMSAFAQVDPRQPKGFVTNGAVDSFGYFRFYNKSYLFDHYSMCVKDHTDDMFYLYKEACIKGKKDKAYLVFPYWNYLLIHPKVFSDKLTASQIKSRLLEKEKIVEDSLDSYKQFIVDDAKFRSIMSLSEGVFLKRYVDGIVIANAPEDEKMAVILRLLKMNIPVSTHDVSGDLIIPRNRISYPVW